MFECNIPNSDEALDFQCAMWSSVFYGLERPWDVNEYKPRPILECPRCAQEFLTLTGMQEHITRDHNGGNLAEVW